MPKGPIRRGQLIAPFGVGALVVVKDGTSAIACGLDHWYVPEGGASSNQDLDIDEYKVEEWRLQQLLAVDHFRLPPDHRRRHKGQRVPNTGLTVPFLRFPRWHFCPFCKLLVELPSSAKASVPCASCVSQGKRNYVVQVPFIAICDLGHICDFPWREWVHGDSNPSCQRGIRLFATGGASLADQKLSCECGKQRSLGNITTAAPDGNTSFLSSNLDKAGITFKCGGNKPWLGDIDAEGCDRPLRGSLRSASNLYYSRVHAAIYLPKSSQGAPPELVALLKVPPLSTLIGLLRSLGSPITPGVLVQQHRELLKPFTETEIKKGLTALEGAEPAPEPARPGMDEPQEVGLRRAEFSVLRAAQDQDELLTSRERMTAYTDRFQRFFSNVTLVYKLRETRVFSGFCRVFPEDSLNLEQHKRMLWRDAPAPSNSWLPANVVYGEGIFLELHEDRLREWEKRVDVTRVVTSLRQRYEQLQQRRRLRNVNIAPRFVLLHTVSHLLINQLTFECGYGSASLRERLYVSADANAPMAGVLIYTAAGDSEGTMGGLVRMGKPGYFEPILEKAIRNAEWCSTDPVCTEIGERVGQGPDACNGAACHNCALVPETSCEQFNRFLDRVALVGTRERRETGFFASLITG